jgi:hypothetical protein
MSFTGTPGINIHKHTAVSERSTELIVEGLPYVRIKCREREHFISLTKKYLGQQNLPLKEVTSGKRGRLFTLPADRDSM